MAILNSTLLRATRLLQQAYVDFTPSDDGVNDSCPYVSPGSKLISSFGNGNREDVTWEKDPILSANVSYGGMGVIQRIELDNRNRKVQSIAIKCLGLCKIAQIESFYHSCESFINE